MKVGLLKEKDFSLLMMGKFISLVGTQMQSFALSLYVYKKTGSAAMFASVIVAALIPFATLITIIVVIGIIMTTANIALSSLFQKVVPLDMMGRVGTVMNTCCMCCIPIGQVVFGFMFDSLSAWICVLICAAILLVSILGFRKSLLGYGEMSSSEMPSLGQVDMN